MEKQRTPNQNKSLHKWCEETAQELNNAGISMQALIENLDIDHTKDSVKRIWQAIGKEKFNKEHTSDFTTKEIQEVYEEMNRLLSKFGIHIPFPSQEIRNLIENYNEYS